MIGLIPWILHRTLPSGSGSKVLSELLRNANGLLYVLRLHRAPLVEGKGLCKTDSRLDLPAVEFMHTAYKRETGRGREQDRDEARTQ